MTWLQLFRFVRWALRGVRPLAPRELKRWLREDPSL